MASNLRNGVKIMITIVSDAAIRINDILYSGGNAQIKIINMYRY